MSNRTLTYLIILIIACVGVVFALNFSRLYIEKEPLDYIDRNYVRGMELVVDGVPYTLNFEQQNNAVTLLNNAIKVGYEALFNEEEGSIGFEKILIYRFDAPPITVTPIAYINDTLLFKVPEWQPNGFLNDTQPGAFKTLIKSAHASPQ